MDLATAPAEVAQALITKASERLDEVYLQYRRMLKDPEIDHDTRLLISGRMTDLTRQMTELASTVTSTFGKQSARAGTGLPPAPDITSESFASPPRPGEPILPTVSNPTQEPL